MRPFLSVCMIVKDEEKVLRRCLESIHGIADEIIIVDTGSTDNTKNIALEFTDKVFDYKWENDFSKARNFAASKARGEWIFVIDADEFVDRDSFQKFKENLQKTPPRNNILAVQIVNFAGENARDTALNYHERLYKNDGTIRYYRSIHEMLKHDNSQENRGIIDFQIYHSGYMKNIVEEKNKSQRNLMLLKNKKDKEPIDYYFLGNEYDRLGDLEKAIKYYQKGFQLKDSLYNDWVKKLLVRLVNTLHRAKRDKEALEIINSCESIYPHLVDFKFYRGKIYFDQGDFIQAKRELEEIIRKKNELKADTSIDFLEYLPRKILGEIYEEENEIELAVHHYSRALAINDADDYLWSKLINLLAKHSSLEELSEFLNNNLLTKKNITPQRVINILLDVPQLNVQKLTRSLLDEPKLSKIENEALFLKNLLLDGNLYELKRLIDEMSKNQIYSILNTKGIFSITDFVILTVELNNIEFQKILYGIEFNPSISNLLNLIFNKKHRKLVEIEEDLFVLIFNQAYVLGWEDVINHLNKKVKHLSIEAKNKIKKIKNKIKLEQVKQEVLETITSNSTEDIKEIKQQLEFLISNHLYEEALLLVDEVLKNEPNNVDYYSIKSVILLNLQKFDMAKEVLDKGLEINPNHVDCLYNLAFIYEQNNQIDIAVKLYRKVLNLTNEETLFSEINSKLEQLQTGSKKKILYLGWLGQNNIGDDVLFELFEHMFYKYNTLLEDVQIDALNTALNQKIDVDNYDLIVLGGGSLFNISYLLDICLEGIKRNIPVVSWGTGVDGFYKNEHIHSISIGRQFKELYDQFKYISVRGPFTKNALLNIDVKNTIDEIGDPALIYLNETLGEQNYHDRKNKKILINWGTSYNNIFGKNEEAVEDELVLIAKSLIAKGYLVTIYPIWTEDIEPVKRLWQKINDKHCDVITEVYDAKTLQQLISQSYLTINLKLHANILSASANVPFISLAYRGKCFDFAKTVDCLEYVIPTDEVDKKRVLYLVESIEKNYDLIIERFMLAKNNYHPKIIQSIRLISDILSEGKKIKNKETSKDICYKLLYNIQKLSTCSFRNIINDFYNLIGNKNSTVGGDLLESLVNTLQAYIKNEISVNSFVYYLKFHFNDENLNLNSLINVLDLIRRYEFLKNPIYLRKPKVSVIITTYNRKQYLEQAILSILKQDYPNIDIIVIDDCSTDGTENMILDNFNDIPLVIYYKNDHNKGPGRNRRFAFENYAYGDYILFLDDDDYLIDKSYLSKAVDFHQKHQETSFVTANVFVEVSKSNRMIPTNLNFDDIINKHDYFIKFGQQGFPKPYSTLTTLFKRESLLNMGILEMKMVNDSSLYLRSLLEGDGGFINEIVGVYRIHGDNITFDLNSDFIIENLEEKLQIKNIAVQNYEYSSTEMEKWFEYQVYSTIVYFFTNNLVDTNEANSIFKWIEINCPSVLAMLQSQNLFTRN